ncbi:unnamed protein product [Penicillium pancosmium]
MSVIFGSDNRGLQIGETHERVEAHFYYYPERPETPPDPLSTVPFPRDPDFIFRGGLLQSIQKKNSISGSRIALVGLGGVGKSQLSIEYSYLVRCESPTTWVFWIHASSKLGFAKSLWDLASKAKIAGRKGSDVNIFTLVENWLQDDRKGKWIVILDNADDPEVLCSSPAGPHTTEGATKPLLSYIPRSENGSVIITSRTRETALKLVHHRNIIHVGPMDKSESLELLQTKLETPDLEETQASRELVEELEFMPLAIVQAASYIREQGDRCSVSQYLRFFRRSDREAIKLLEQEQIIYNRDESAEVSIFLTWQISFDHIQEMKPSAADLLSLMCFFDRQSIPDHLVRHRSRASQDDRDSEPPQNSSGNEAKEAEIDHDFEKDVLTLKNYSLISVADLNTFTMHRLVQLATRAWLENHGKITYWREAFIDNLYWEFPRVIEYGNWEQCRSLSPHIQSAVSQQPESQESRLRWAEILWHCASFALESGNNILGARDMASTARNQMIDLLSAGDMRVIECTMVLANAYSLEGEWPFATNMIENSVETCMEALGVDHPLTAKNMYFLALSFEKQGKRDKAELLQIQLVEVHKKISGENHPLTLGMMHNLALRYQEDGKTEEADRLWSYVKKAYQQSHETPALKEQMGRVVRASMLWNQGCWTEAENYFVQELQTETNNKGNYHPDTLASKVNLASIYHSQGQWEKAQSLLVQAVEGYDKWLGPGHPETLAAMNDLVSIYTKQGRFGDAESIQVRVVEAYKTKLGANHSQTLIRMSSLACVYLSHGRLDEAAHLQEKVVEERKALFGHDHPETLMCIANLASTYSKQGRHDKAEDLRIEIKETQERTLALDNIDRVGGIRDLSVVYQNQGRWEEAKLLLTQAIENSKNQLGSDHIITLASMDNLASMYIDQHMWEDAILLLVQVVKVRGIKLGEGHRETLTSMDKLAGTYMRHGLLEEAEDVQMRVVKARKVNLGEHAPDTIRSMNNLAMVYNEQERFEEAENLQTQVVSSREIMLGVYNSDTLLAIDLLAAIYLGQGQWDKAAKLQERVIEAKKAKLGIENPDTLASMHTLAELYLHKGPSRWTQVEEILTEIIEIRKEKLGLGHHDTLSSKETFLEMLISQERWEEAETVGTEILEIRKIQLGVGHDDTLRSMSELVKISMVQDRLDDAERLELLFMETCKANLGEKHPDTILSMSRLAGIYVCKGDDRFRFEAAEKLQVQVVENQKARLGVNHPATLESMNNLAVILRVLGREDEAEQYQLQVKMLESLKSVWPSVSVQAHHNHY